MKKLFVSLFLFVLCGLGLLWSAGSFLSWPVNHAVVMPNANYMPFDIKGTHGSILRVEQSQKCALLLHGVRGDRTSMIHRAEFLKTLGISSALIDMQAHGETKGEKISFGYFESNDASNAMQFLRDKLQCEKVVIIGQSLGGAAAVLGAAAAQADALVLESVYPTIEEAVRDRLESKVGELAGLFAPLLYRQIPLRIDVPLEALRPIEALKSITVPVYIISGSLDRSTTPSETQRMYDAVNSRKLLWIVEGAAHQDIYAFNPNLYEQKITAFLKANLF